MSARICPTDGSPCAIPACRPGCIELAKHGTPNPSTADRLRARLKRLEEIEGSYTAYLQDRIKERDWHGGWDVCINLSEVSCERDGLLFALEALGESA